MVVLLLIAIVFCLPADGDGAGSVVSGGSGSGGAGSGSGSATPTASATLTEFLARQAQTLNRKQQTVARVLAETTPTARPQLNRRSAQLVAASTQPATGPDFHERLLASTQRKRAWAHERALVDQECTFTPSKARASACVCVWELVCLSPHIVRRLCVCAIPSPAVITPYSRSLKPRTPDELSTGDHAKKLTKMVTANLPKLLLSARPSH